MEGSKRLHTSTSEFSYVSCINYTMANYICIQFTLPGKARQTIAKFLSNFHPNWTEIYSICPWTWTIAISRTNFRINTLAIFLVMCDRQTRTYIHIHIHRYWNPGVKPAGPPGGGNNKKQNVWQMTMNCWEVKYKCKL